MAKRTYAIVDIETTGGFFKRDRITEIAIVLHDGQKIIKQFSSLVNPERSIPPEITRITGITNEMVQDAPKFYEIAKEIVQLLEGTIFVAHNVRFDYTFIKNEFKSLGYTFTKRQLCTVKLSRKAFPGLRSYSLGNLIRHFGIQVEARHRALDDTLATTHLFEAIVNTFDEKDELKLFINQGIKESQLPKGISIDQLHDLPEEAGVYYFINEHQRVVYIGKAKNIKQRIFQHFNKVTSKSAKLYQQVKEISFELTGNELIALLHEAHEIKLRQPEINKALRRTTFPYFLGSYTDELDFKRLEVYKSSNKSLEKATVLHEYSALKHGRTHLTELIQEYEICQNQTKCRGLNHIVCTCHGNCEEPPADHHNKQINELHTDLKALFDEDFIIIDEGRSPDERSVILVEDGQYRGFGYIASEDVQYGIEEIKESIKEQQYYPIMNKLIWNYLQDHRPKIIYLGR